MKSPRQRNSHVFSDNFFQNLGAIRRPYGFAALRLGGDQLIELLFELWQDFVIGIRSQ